MWAAGERMAKKIREIGGTRSKQVAKLAKESTWVPGPR